jgi:hypothetical protein
MILTNVGKLNYLIVKTLLNVKGFKQCEIFFLSAPIALNGAASVSW